MKQISDPVGHSPSPDRSRSGHREQLQPEPHTKIRGLSDRQAVIAAMVANGDTCQDIAFELLLPLRTVQGHLLRALRILGLSRVEDLTYSVISAHQAKNLATAMTRSKGAGALGSAGAFEDDGSLNSLVALDAAEAEGPLGAQVADLTRELAVARIGLDEQHRKVQQLHEALDSRDSIGQAKGVLMERHRISSADAFTMLQRQSNQDNRKLVDVAKALIRSAGHVTDTQAAAALLPEAHARAQGPAASSRTAVRPQ